MNGVKTTILGGLHNVDAWHGRQTEIASHQVRIIAWEQDDLAATDHKVFFTFAVDPNVNFALEDVVINNQMGRGPERRPAMFARDARRNTPRLEEIGMQEHAAGQMRHPQDVG